ncbi:MAG: hypothetical protein DCC53_11630 [Chloroflexi bacterium]|nr:MAG: hypothetical protein DCC53_11630 [Chloroflexota bacterium]
MYFNAETGRTTGKLVFDPSKMGPPGHAHGGAVVTVLDEAMGAAAWASNLTVLAVNLNADLRISVPIGVEITVVGHVERIEGRKVYTAASLILPDGRVAATSRGLFLTVDLPGDMTDNPFRPL